MVKDTECTSPGTARTAHSESEVFPAPDGAEITALGARSTILGEEIDAADADRMFSVLMGDDVEVRKKFIDENAVKVKNLDI